MNDRDVGRALLGAGAAASGFMAGMIWTIHRVHYPLMARVGEDAHVAYMDEHRRRISTLILLPWAVEAVAATATAAHPPEGVGRPLALAGLAAAAVTAVDTAARAVPAHGRLAGGFDAQVHDDLLRVNRLRTAAWTAHAAISLVALARGSRAAAGRVSRARPA